MPTGSATRELRPMLSLALPVIVGEIGWMAMGVVDTLMVGPLGPEAIGGAGMGSTIFFAVGVFGMGALLGLDTLVSQAYGARNHVDCHRWLLHGVVLALLLAVPLTAAAYLITASLPAWGLNPDVLPLVTTFMNVVNLSVVPLLLYAALRRYLQAVGSAMPVMFALVSANLVNFFVNWLLVLGNLGAPALGVAGSAWATVLSRAYMVVVLAVAIVVRERRAGTGLWQTPLQLEAARFARLLRLGGPAALQLSLEVGIFAAATALAGRLESASLASHQIALMVISVIFMVPLGISSAGAVRVGQALGRSDPGCAARAGWTAIALGMTAMACAALVMIAVPRPLIRLFTADLSVGEIGGMLLRVAAMFQLFDGLQVVATGTLRGLGETRTPMIANLVGHWGLGLPVGYILCFKADWGVVGLWVGLSVGLTLVGLVLAGVWAHRVRILCASHPA
jgi:MATE family multidrug resistance protein